MHRLLARQLKKSLGEAPVLSPGMSAFIALVDQAYAEADESRELIRRSMELSSRELVERNGKLMAAEEKFRTIFENATQAIFQIAPDGTYVTANPALARLCGYTSPAEMMAVVTNVSTLYAEPTRWAELVREITAHGRVEQRESDIVSRDGTRLCISETTRAVFDRRGQLMRYEGTAHDVTAMKQAEAARLLLQGQLVEASRESGMAEVATSVLHNVGNVLNSLEVSWSLASKRLAGLRTASLAKVARLFEEHACDLPAFFAPGAKGTHVPAYLDGLATHLVEEQAKIQEELASLGRHLEHVKRVVSMQQSYARNTGVLEAIDVQTLVEDALKLARTATPMDGVNVVRDYRPLPHVDLDKHRVIEILVNLFTNARQAMLTSASPQLTIALGPVEGDGAPRFSITVKDTGDGIRPENLARIFNHGFTTKPKGHGYGLHSSALAAHNMHGQLRVVSDGQGKGAAFTLELPVHGGRNATEGDDAHG